MSKTLKPFVSIVLVTLMLITVSAAADTGSIGVRSTPDHADVYIDGKLLCTGCTEKYNSQFFKGISVGYHTVTVKKSGYVDWSKIVYVSKAGGFAFSSANLEPVSAETPAQIATPDASSIPIHTGDTGSIGVRSTPDHADVYIDGKLLCTGCTEKYNSQFFKGISVGYHTVTVKKSGYVDWSKIVYVSKAGGFAFSSANLEPVSAETPAPTITAVPSTPTPTPTPTPTLTPIHTPTPLPTPTPVVIPPVTPTPSPSSTPAPPGFEAIFTIAGLLAVAYLLRRRD